MHGINPPYSLSGPDVFIDVFISGFLKTPYQVILLKLFFRNPPHQKRQGSKK
jgi:hypothetical protein